MADGCRQENHANAGFELGAFIGAATLAGRDKLTVVLPESLSMLGLWIEQLIAESTGKQNKGALPVVDEPLGPPEQYGQDRAFVAIATDRDAPDKDLLASLMPLVSGLPYHTADGSAEFFRGVRPAVAGAALLINPFAARTSRRRSIDKAARRICCHGAIAGDRALARTTNRRHTGIRW